MGISDNLRGTLQAYKELNHLSLTELSDELGIARSTVQDILAGNSNVRSDTLEIISKKLGIDSALIISDAFTPSQIQIVLLLFNAVQSIAALPQDNRCRLAEMFCEAVQLLTVEYKQFDGAVKKLPPEETSPK